MSDPIQIITNPSLLKLYDRSRVTTDWKCARARYLGYEFEGKGLTSTNLSLPLHLGTAVHDGLAAIATQYQQNGVVDISTIARVAGAGVRDALREADGDGPGSASFEAEYYAQEQGTLVEGLLRGFYKAAWPRILAQFPVIRCVEQEMTYHHDGLTFMSRPDLVLMDTSGCLWYLEYKTTSSKKEGWIHQWSTAIQLHSTIRAIENTLGEKVVGVIVQGLYKGYESYGKQSSPFCYGYHRQGTPPFSNPETIYEYRSGFKRYPTWEMEGGVSKWVEGMPEAILGDQFPQTPPIFVKDHMVEAFFKQRGVRENEISLAMQMLEQMKSSPESYEAILNTSFPQNFGECQPGFGYPCQFRTICHGGISNPLDQGFVYREPHHQLEIDQHEQTNG